MNSRARNRTLIFIIVLLLLTNIGILCYFLVCNKKQEPPRPKKNNFESVLRNEVGFDDAQVEAFRKVREENWVPARKKMKAIAPVKNELLKLSRENDVPDSVVTRLVDSIGNLQRQVEYNFFRHIQLTRKICKPDQQAAYDSLMYRLVNRSRSSKSNNKK